MRGRRRVASACRIEHVASQSSMRVEVAVELETYQPPPAVHSDSDESLGRIVPPSRVTSSNVRSDTSPPANSMMHEGVCSAYRPSSLQQQGSFGATHCSPSSSGSGSGSSRSADVSPQPASAAKTTSKNRAMTTPRRASPAPPSNARQSRGGAPAGHSDPGDCRPRERRCPRRSSRRSREGGRGS